MSYRQIEKSREARLWIGQIIMPIVSLIGMVIVADPELRQGFITKVKNMRYSLVKRFKRG